MLQELSHLAQVLGFAVLRASAAVANVWRATIDPAGRYRPEAHYMRGPGPKWRAKHAQVATPHPMRLMHEQLLDGSVRGANCRRRCKARRSPPPRSLGPRRYRPCLADWQRAALGSRAHTLTRTAAPASHPIFMGRLFSYEIPITRACASSRFSSRRHDHARTDGGRDRASVPALAGPASDREGESCSPDRIRRVRRCNPCTARIGSFPSGSFVA
jgi:hypothetical protein